MTETKKYTFPKAEKLKSRKQIDLLFRSGKSFFAAPVKCFFLISKMERPEDGKSERPEDRKTEREEGEVRGTKFEVLNEGVGNSTGDESGGLMVKAGFSVSKKLFKKAVDRNRVKRLMREAYRLHKHRLMAQVNNSGIGLEIFFVFTDRNLPDYSLVEDKIKYCLRRLGKIVEEKA